MLKSKQTSLYDVIVAVFVVSSLLTAMVFIAIIGDDLIFDLPDRSAEILGYTVYAMLPLSFILFFVWLVLTFRAKQRNAPIILVSVTVATLFFFSVAVFATTSMNYSLLKHVEKIAVNGNYYLISEDIKVVLTAEQYESVNEGDNYNVLYKAINIFDVSIAIDIKHSEATFND